MSENFWNSVDLKEYAIPDDVKLKSNDVILKDGIKTITDVNIFYREALPPKSEISSKVSVLLLHGMRFSSKTWLDLKTIQILAAMGYRTVAVDLPGYANSPSATIEDKAKFLQALIQSFALAYPVIVSPSMSGYYSLPYLLKYEKNLAGYVPVAPVGYEVLEKFGSSKTNSRAGEIYEPLREFLKDPIPDLSGIETPTMVVFGEKDRSKSSALLSLLPCSQCQEIPNGGHPAYLDDPDLWHQLLYNFLNAVSEHINVKK